MTEYLNNLFMDLIRHFDQNINQAIRSLSEEFNLSTFIVLLSIAFIYGILHSAGPGHGKTIIATYFFKDRHRILKSLSLSALVSLVHTITAIILAFLLSFVFTGVRGLFRIKLQSYFIFSSGLMIMLIALIFFAIKYINIYRKKSHKIEFKKNMFLTGISAGIVPCPVSLMVMLFAISNNIIIVGLSVVLSISFGMFILLSIIGLISISSRNKLIRFSDDKLKKSELIAHIIENVSIIVMFLVGFLMVYKTFSIVI